MRSSGVLDDEIVYVFPSGAVTNQFNSIPGTSVSYDANGNLLTDNLNAYTWDPNWGNMLSVTRSTTVTATYDAVGRVVEQQSGSTTTEILYSPLGKTALMNGAALVKAFVGLPGGATAVYNSAGLAYYRHSDHLGSSRLASTATRGLYSATSYAPFGEQFASAGTSDASFTGQNSDTTASLYDFTFREHSMSQGRWISPDPLGVGAADPTNPQTWNRYAYVANNPLSAIDPTGLNEDFCGAEYDNCGGGIGVVGGGIGGGGGGGGFGGGGGPGVGFGGSGTPGLQNGLNQYLSYIPPFGDGWAPCTTPGSDCWYNTTTDANWYPGEFTSGVGFSDPTILTGTGGGSGGAGGGTGGCSAKVLAAVNNRFGTNYTDANVNSTFNYSTGAPPGQGTLNLNVFGSTAGISPGYYPVHWWTYAIGYGPTLHAVSGPGGNGGLDSTQTLQFGPNQATFHIDSGFPYNPSGAFFHWLLNMTKAGGYPQC